MAISPVINAVSHMSWLPPQASPVKPATGWKPAPLPAASAAKPAAGPGEALAKGARDAAKQAFLFGLKISFSDQDRVTAARGFLNYANALSNETLQSDPTLASLQSLAQSIVSRTQSYTATYLSGISTVA
jgi:hypothetical protein